ncbi:IQ-DOMAIN 5-RELATED [Salix koriyanagi]|uniref:IQ-DOMAIN 5-RELATED n=1 Tax=Salix koriyanagi TaxID=2511006 RepID=A0A9Q0UEF9_9ROSI|nr:IQ-DOMAIN 5-RELATED [Salix koriyanagi]
MGSGDWFKTIISIKKVKDDSSKQAKGSSTSAKSNGFKWKNKLRKESASFANGSNRANPRFLDMPVEDLAATRIQTAFRAYRVEWSGGSETMEEALARIHQREEAAVKRERAMAYAFFSSADCGWSWKECWISARPWESRVAAKSVSPKKMKSRQTNKVDETTKLPTRKTPVSSKPSSSNGKGTSTTRRLSYPPAEKRVSLQGKSDAANNKREQLVS